MDINKRIKARRIQLNLTLKDVADALGVAESTVSRYETSDIRNMGIDKIKALADVLETTPSYLMGWSVEDQGKYSYVDSAAIGKIMLDPDLQKLFTEIVDMTSEEKKELLDYALFLKKKREG